MRPAIRLWLLMLVGVTGLALPALAQGTAAPPPATTAAQAPATVPTVNAEELGVSVDRIRLQFRRDQPLGDVFDPARFKLSTYVDVVATAPPLQLFGPDPKTALTTGAVPFGGPTHRDMLNIMTPQEFRTPPADLTALIEWLSERLRKQSDRDRE